VAGATGAPTLLCLPFTPDYRWELHSPTTPWYRNMTILRQPEAFAWEAVLEQVRSRVAMLR